MYSQVRFPKQLMVVCSVMVVILWLIPLPLQAQAAADFVFVGVPGVTLGLGAEFDVTIQIDAGVTEVNAAQVALDFDPVVLEVVAVVGGSTLPVEIDSAFDNSAGVVSYAAALFSDTAVGTFDLVTITFRTLANGSTALVHRTDINDPPVAEINGPPGGQDVTGARGASEQITVDETVAITLSWFLAEQSDDTIVFRWQTATESNTAGFNILAAHEDELQALNPSLIPSKVIDSVEPTDYDFTATTASSVYYLEEMELSGIISRQGPFDLGQEYGVLIEDTDPDDDSSATEERHLIYLPIIAGK